MTLPFLSNRPTANSLCATTRRAHRLAALALAAAVLAGCTTRTYLYEGRQYRSAAGALEAQQRTAEAMLNEIPAIPQPVRAKALVVVPRRDRIFSDAVVLTGNAARLSKEQVEFVITSIEAAQRFQYEALKKRNLFETVEFQQTESPEATKFNGYDYLIYLYAQHLQLQWYMKGANWPAPRPITLDNGKPTPALRTISWLDCVEQFARTESAGK
ncbi:MAG: hypothetical protein ABSA97_12100 [Verrucomicrobiia bacterium]